MASPDTRPLAHERPENHYRPEKHDQPENHHQPERPDDHHQLDRADGLGGLDQELASEHRYLSAARAALDHLIQTARMRAATGADIAGDGYTAETLGRMLRGQAKVLTEEPGSPLYFGRLDFGTGPEAGDHGGQRYYIGRRHLADQAGTPLVLDWRAPVSRVFYQASRTDSQGVRVRRRFGWTTRRNRPAELTGFEDEHLTGPDEHLPPTGGQQPGPDVASELSRLVQAEIERPRVGPMRDIVATIQPEQDRLVRAGLDESLCVQGAPGTGKTAVGLHRAAYLLYTYQQRLDRAGVLVLGPNTAFLRYVSGVLPALGEVDIRQSTLEDLLARHPVRGEDSTAAVAVKHDVRMATVLRRALYAHLVEPTEPLTVPDGSFRWRVSTETLRRLVAEIRDEELPYGLGRERLRARTVAMLQRHAETRDTPGAAWVRRMSRCRPVTAFLDAVWPAVRPEDLVASVLGDPAVLARAADGVLSVDEQATIRWRRPVKARSAAWTSADLLLVDEAAGLVERPEGFGHIVVDEAQDLSPMQCRAIARRNEHGSLTVLGDLAQATTPWAARTWAEQLVHLGKPNAPVLPLTTGFRVPAAVLDLANRLLAVLDVDVPRARSLRSDGQLHVERVADLPAATVATVRSALRQPGSVAVIATDRELPRLAEALRSAGIATTAADTAATGRTDAVGRVTVLPAGLAKGLEYDHVVVVEPADIVAAEPRGAHRLYVVLTRAVSRLDILHSRDLPAPLER
ncbi:ATPase AAA [Micromonospora sonneratiae]|uniref:HelD family protein n=1 Tax=Micromonospora sonneratiae TaxID=1184706 RepID=A0ABW3YKB4_9ACTN